jgi:hypothetical protein
MSSNAGGCGVGGGGGGLAWSSAVHMDGAQINLGDLTPHLTYVLKSLHVFCKA